MDVELRQLRCLVGIVDAGTFTDAAIELGVSQAAVSRNLLSLERELGVRLLHRTSRTITPTTVGVQVLARARQVLAEVDELVREATTGHTRLRVGHAWSAVGRYTAEFQRRWAAEHPDIELQLVRTNTATGGLAEGLCDLAIVRTQVDQTGSRRRRSRRNAGTALSPPTTHWRRSAPSPWTNSATAPS